MAGFALVLLSAVREPWFKQFWRDKLVWLIAAYALITVLLALVKPTDQDAEILAVVYNLRFLVFFIYGLLLARLFGVSWLKKRAIAITMAVACIVLIFGFVQYIWLPDNALTHVGYGRANGVLPAFHIDDKPDLERAMSTLRDPNSYGSYLLIILAVTIAYLSQIKNPDLRRMLAGMLALVLLNLYFTFSRGAWIGAVLTAGSLLVLKYMRGKKLKLNKGLIAAATALLVLAAGGLFAARDTYFVRNVIFHADESTVLEDPNELRLRFWRESLQAAADKPLGYGPGTAGLASIRNDVQGTVLNENYYLQILHEVGVAGLTLFIGILAMVALRLYKLAADNVLAAALLAAFTGLLATNFLVHAWSNEAVAYTWWGLAGVILLTGKKTIPVKKSK